MRPSNRDVTPLKDKHVHMDNTTRQHRPRVVEIIGPAGAGKTTLLRELQRRDPGIVAGIQQSRVRYAPFLIRHALTFFPRYLCQYRHDRWFTWAEHRSMVYLEGWHRRLSQHAEAVVVFDHGPLFELVTLADYGPELTKSRAYRAWLDCMFTRWAATLDVIVWLDAPSSILAERIHERDRWHVVKGKPQREVYDYLARFRQSYEEIIDRLTALAGPTLLRYGTEQQSVHQIADHVLSELGPRSSTVPQRTALTQQTA